MHATLQPGDCSPKQVNGPTSTSQLKPGSDNKIKGKKRERGDHGMDSIKRERSSRTDDGDSGQYKSDNNLKSEIAKITKKGGVVDLEGVEKLVQLMQVGRMERKMDLVGRSMLAGVMAATDKFDCLNWFVQLRGLPVLDEWLQDIHKGKIGDGNSLKESDASVEEFLLVLLRALDKLPVNLHALQMCNIGKSVNHLRSHKNFEIQRKARSLVDTWKKRVEVEMISIDAKSAQAVSSWSSKSRLPEASHGGNRFSNVADAATNSSITQHSISKTTSHGESNTKSASSSPGPVKSVSSTTSGKESQPRISADCAGDTPLVREDRSSSSNQSHNYCQSVSAKDGKSSTAGSVTVNKISTGSYHHRKFSDFPGTSPTGRQKETSSSRSSVHRTITSEKLSQSALTSEKVLEEPSTEGSGHKLIVKITNRMRSPALGVTGGFIEDHSITSSRASYQALSDKHHQLDHGSKGGSDAYQCILPMQMNMESRQSNDSKIVLTRSDKGPGSPLALPNEEQSRTIEDCQKLIEGTKGNQLKSRKLNETAFGPMNALIESCVRYSEANSFLSLEDDVGINLLASVATGEISRTDLVSPTNSTESTRAVDEVGTGDNAKSKSSTEYPIEGAQSKCCNDADLASEQQAVFFSCPLSKDGIHQLKHASLVLSGYINCAPSQTSGHTTSGEGDKNFQSSGTDLNTADSKLEIIGKSMNTTSPVSTDEMRDGELSKGNDIGVSDCKTCGTDSVTGDNVANRTVEAASSNKECEGDSKKSVNEELNSAIHPQQKLTAAIVKSELTGGGSNEKLQRSFSCHKSNPEKAGDVKVGEADERDGKTYVNQSERESSDRSAERNTAVEGKAVAGLYSDDLKNDHVVANVENKEIPEKASLPEKLCLASLTQEALKNTKLRESKDADFEVNETDCASSVAEVSSSSHAGVSDLDPKIKFDLNEGFSVDDGKYGDLANLMASGSTAVHHMVNRASFVVNPRPSAPAITVAAAAKGPFVPPEDLLRIKGELGWKGSAATSAFRPAEPRKVLELPQDSTSMILPDASSTKNGRTLLDIDLNVPDEGVLAEIASRDSAFAVGSPSGFVSSGSVPFRCYAGLDLDLNRVDVTNDNGQCSTSGNHKVEGPFVSVNPLGGLPSHDFRRDFDLNDGPGVDDSSAEQLLINQQGRGGVPLQLHAAGFRMVNPEVGNLSSWFPAGNTHSTGKFPLPDRGDHPFPIIPSGAPQRIFTPIGNTSFPRDVYRGSVLSSSPAVPFPPGPFQYPFFPLGTAFPLPSATFPVGASSYADSSSGGRLFTPHVNSQLLGPVDGASSQFQRPYVVCLPDGSSNWGLENNRKWGGKQALDLNAGLGTMDTEGREETVPWAVRQLPVASSQAFAEEQARRYSITGAILKRKDPEGGRG